MSCWTIIGGLAGVCLLIAATGGLLVHTYEAGFRDGYAQGRLAESEVTE